MQRVKLAVLLAVFCLSGGVLSAQVLYGSLVGNVTDPQQASVVKAAVNINNKATGFSLATTTDERGVYEIVNIPPGAYDVKITGAQRFEIRFDVFNLGNRKNVATVNNVIGLDPSRPPVTFRTITQVRDQRQAQIAVRYRF